jgi:hypothetical protein
MSRAVGPVSTSFAVVPRANQLPPRAGHVPISGASCSAVCSIIARPAAARRSARAAPPRALRASLHVDRQTTVLSKQPAAAQLPRQPAALPQPGGCEPLQRAAQALLPPARRRARARRPARATPTRLRVVRPARRRRARRRTSPRPAPPHGRRRAPAPAAGPAGCRSRPAGRAAPGASLRGPPRDPFSHLGQFAAPADLPPAAAPLGHAPPAPRHPARDAPRRTAHQCLSVPELAHERAVVGVLEDAMRS